MYLIVAMVGIMDGSTMGYIGGISNEYVPETSRRYLNCRSSTADILQIYFSETSPNT